MKMGRKPDNAPIDAQNNCTNRRETYVGECLSNTPNESNSFIIVSDYRTVSRSPVAAEQVSQGEDWRSSERSGEEKDEWETKNSKRKDKQLFKENMKWLIRWQVTRDYAMPLDS